MSTTKIPNQYASPGAVRQHGGTLPIHTCDTCGAEVVWAESRRSGRRYLANVSRGYHGQRFYVGADLHDCAAVIAHRDALDDRLTKGARIAELTAQAQEAMSRGDKAEALRLVDLMGQA